MTRRSFSWALVSAGMSRAQTPPDRRKYWDDLFRKDQVPFNKEASQLLQYAIAGRKPGRAIDLGMGEGRNAVFLASSGWQVTGVDFSEVAVNRAKARAAAAGLSIKAIVDDLDHFPLGREKWDLIALFYMHAWFHESKRDVPRVLAEGLRPGGVLVIEGYAGDKGDFQTNELARKFDILQIVFYQDAMDEADWAPGEKSRVIRFIGEKPDRGSR